MTRSDCSQVSFDDSDTRRDEMHSTMETWVEDLVDEVDDAVSSEQCQEWLDIQSCFHDYSYRNTLLIIRQCPHATRVASYRTWQNEFDRHVTEGESAIWWAPIIAKQCPECENSPSYHDRSDCEYDETAAEDWSKGLVGFRPAPVFDISQTEGEPLPKLKTEATGEADELVPALLEGASMLEVEVEVVSPAEWPHGDARGVCQYRSPAERPLIEVRDRKNSADLAVTTVHEYAHALLHSDVDGETERSKRELEAEAVGYIVGRYFGLDTSGSAFYLAAWEGEESEAIFDRLERISSTAAEIIDVVDEVITDK